MYTALRCLTHGSPLLSQTTPVALAEFCKDKFHSVALTDYSQLYMCVQYYQAMKDAGIKPMLGFQVKIYGGEDSGWATVIAKDKKGWEDVLHLIYLSNQNYKDEPKIEVFEFIKWATSNVIIITDVFLDIFERLCPQAYYGVNLVEGVRAETTLKKVAVTPNHYLTKDDWLLNKYLVANYAKETLKACTHPVLCNNKYYIPTEEELLQWGYTQEEIDETNRIFEQVTEFDILYSQELPAFDCPDGLTEPQYLRQLCREGYKRLGLDGQEYIDRIKHELAVIEKAGMSGYFLIMYDIISWCRSQDILVGTGRGSAAGCLISYLIGITNVDPIKYKLMFERFYTPERQGDLIDIDTDLPPSKRDLVIQYIQDKYEEEYFAQLSTFSTLKGPAAIKTVLRAIGADAQEQNEITKKMPPEAKIAPYLQKQYDEVGSKSMVLWCINHIDEFKQWCSPNFEGAYAAEFQAAIQLDQTIIGRGRHASAYALSNTPIYKRAPFIWDESAGRYVVGLSMDDAEKMSLIKLDLLSIALLDKADFIRKVVKNGAF